jgi:hypothetical protein
MPLYEKPLTEIIATEALQELPETFSAQQMLDWIQARYPAFKDTTVRAHLRSMSVNDRNRRHYSRRRDDLFKLGRSLYRRYDSDLDGIYDDKGELIDGPLRPDLDDEEEELASEEEIQFALELHLEEFMEENWSRIDFGRELALYQAPDGRSGRQFPTEIGVIDFLCVDKTSGGFVVIELKRGRGSDKVLGQCQRYMGWVQERLATGGEDVRGLIIAPSRDDRLRFALKVAPNVDMLTYRVQFQLAKPGESANG